ncbi:hypothetical protein OAH36_02415 [Verrucomicrobia bacterium]|nr:hypothetical protein [Verrucomicrobiota bacterium]MDB4798431.1 hypothetical protein [Verrucomicrobiota bacterium]
MKASKSIRAVAIASISIGASVLLVVADILVSNIVGIFNIVEGLSFLSGIALLFLSPLLIPPLMALVYGVQLYRAPNKAAVKGAIAGLTLIGFFLLFGFSQRLFELEIEGNYIFLLMAITTVPVYAVISKHLIVSLLAEPIVRGEFVGKRLRGLIAILVGLAFYSMMKGQIINGPSWLAFAPIFVASFAYYIFLGIRPEPPQVEVE